MKGLLVFFIICFTFFGKDLTVELIKIFIISSYKTISVLNTSLIELTGDSILATAYNSIITFFIVGIILEVFNIPRGKFGKHFGKLAFWLTGYPVSFALNWISSLIFN